MLRYLRIETTDIPMRPWWRPDQSANPVRQALSHEATRSVDLGNSQNPGSVGSRVELSETRQSTAMIPARHVGVARAPRHPWLTWMTFPPQPNQKKTTPTKDLPDFALPLTLAGQAQS